MQHGDGPLSPTSSAGLAAPNAQSPDGTMRGLVCPNCQHAFRQGALACSHCGVLLAEGVNTTRIAEEKAPAPKYAPIGAVFVEEQKPITFFVDGVQVALPIADEIVVGRLSELTGSQRPDVDLAAFGAEEQGVSRQHAKIVRKRELTYVVDLGSTNGTFLNGRRLVRNQERLLRSGDELRLGRLKVNVRF
jgi:FHA domain